MNQETAEKILKDTELGYDLMSQKFSQTRKYFWRFLEFIADYAQKGDKVLDFGCGNGRLLELIRDKNIDYYGVDVSQKLIDIARQKHLNGNFSKIYPVKSAEGGAVSPQFNRASPSQASLAFADGFFNTVYSIAVFHHFPGKEYREGWAKELYRLTKKDGHIIITVWNLWQKKYIKNIIDNWFDKIYLSFGSSIPVRDAGLLKHLDWNDCNIAFKNNQGEIFNRYHHAFTKREIKNLFKKAGFKIEKCEIIGGRNILLIGKKVNS